MISLFRKVTSPFQLLLVVFVLLVFSSTLQAKQFTVSNKTQLADAIKDARPGDQIVMTAGTWTDVEINFNSQATKLKPVWLTCIPGKVILTGKSRLRFGAPFLKVEGLYFRDGMSDEGEPVIDFESYDCELTNVAIVNFNPKDPRVGYHWVYFSGSGNQVSNCLFEGKSNPRPVIANGCCEARRNRVSDSYFKNIKYVPENGREIIQVQGVGRSDQYTGDGAFFVIERNLFERADGEGAEIISIKSNFNQIRYNTIRASRGGITLRSGYANTVEANFILGEGRSGTMGIRVQGPRETVTNNYIEGVSLGLQLHTGERLFSRGCIADYLTIDFLPLKRPEAPCGYVGRYGQVYDSVFSHNTLVNISGTDISVGIGYKNRWPYEQMLMIPERNVFANNLIYKPAGGTAVFTQRPDETAPINRLAFSPNVFLGNLVFGAELLVSPPSSDDFGFVFADPKLTKSDGMFRPAKDSPVIDRGFSERFTKGRPVSNLRFDVSEDIEGKSRNGRPDIGADEVTTQQPRRHPLTANDVGPTWMRSTFGVR